jgi:hypothetical protein
VCEFSTATATAANDDDAGGDESKLQHQQQ